METERPSPSPESSSDELRERKAVLDNVMNDVIRLSANLKPGPKGNIDQDTFDKLQDATDIAQRWSEMSNPTLNELNNIITGMERWQAYLQGLEKTTAKPDTGDGSETPEEPLSPEPPTEIEPAAAKEEMPIPVSRYFGATGGAPLEYMASPPAEPPIEQAARREGWDRYTREIMELKQSTQEFIARYVLPYRQISAESQAGTISLWNRATKAEASLLGTVEARLTHLQTLAESALQKQKEYQQNLISITDSLGRIDEMLADLKRVDISKISKQGQRAINQAKTRRNSLTEAFQQIEGQLAGYTALVAQYQSSIKNIAYSAGITVKNEALGITEEIKKEDLSRDIEGEMNVWLNSYDDAVASISGHVITETGERGFVPDSLAEMSKRTKRTLLEALFNYIFGINQPAVEGSKT